MLSKEFSSDLLEGALKLERKTQFELDGPERGEPGKQKIEEPSRVVEEFISESELCISDNGVWPHSIAAKGIIFANFLWSDYWKIRLEEDAMIDRQRNLERQVAAGNSKRIANPEVASVAQGSSLPVHDTVPFLRYPSDLIARQKRAGKTIWIAGGTTTIEKDWLDGIKVALLDSGFQALERETWLLSSCEQLPAVVIGRPGLGSIRDSISAGIPFIPSFSDLGDPEMKTNAQFVARAFWERPDLVTHATEIQGLVDLLNEVMRNPGLWREKFETRWLSMSGDPAGIAESLLDMA